MMAVATTMTRMVTTGVTAVTTPSVIVMTGADDGAVVTAVTKKG